MSHFIRTHDTLRPVTTPSFSSRSLPHDISFCPLKQEFLRRDLARHGERGARFLRSPSGEASQSRRKSGEKKGARSEQRCAEERARSIDTRLPFDSLPVDKRRAAAAVVLPEVMRETTLRVKVRSTVLFNTASQSLATFARFIANPVARGFKLKTRRDTKMCARDKKKKVSSPREDKRKVRRKDVESFPSRARLRRKRTRREQHAKARSRAFLASKGTTTTATMGTTTKTRRKRKRTFCQNDGRSTEREEASRIEGAVCISRTPARTRFAETRFSDGTAGNRDEAVIRIDRHNEDAVVEEDGLRSRV